MELTYDEAEAIGLDGTGRDLDPRFPYTDDDLTYRERADLVHLYTFALDVHGLGPIHLAERIDQLRASGPTWPGREGD